MDIYICDASDEKMNDMVDYCHSNNLSLRTFVNVDVSDVSGSWDTISMFTFTDESDALAFKLKYG